MMPEPIRIPPEEARDKISSGSAKLICAYDDDQKFKNNHLEGAVSMGEFKADLPTLSKDSEIIFYCA
jgi:rhodanese-related sulfurtransferase